MPDSGPRKILVAVDFGTTFSGVAWADTRRKTRTIIKDWPGGTGNDDKVPTILQYESSTFSDGRKWGFEVERDSQKPTYEMFKLGLDPKREKETSLARNYPSFVRLPTNSADVEKLVVDYLTALRENFEIQLADLPNSLDLQSIPKQYIITVPAMWSEPAQDKTRSCAERAGMGQKQTIGIISEPEAAAIRVLEEMREDEYRFEKDDTFVVCDAGGGTVDLISYTVTGLDPVLQVEEAVKGEGHVCGGMFVNRVFAEYMRETYGNQATFNDEVLEDAVREFEQNIKKRFDGNVNNKYKIRVGIQNGRDVRDGNLRLSGRQVMKFFDPVIEKIESLVLAQLRATKQRVKCVILVGGFGGNKYLKTRLESAVGDGVRVKRPKNTLTAVVEGALIRGLVDAQPGNAHIRIESRIARRYYGTSSYVPYESGVHDFRRSSNSYGNRQILTLQWFAKQNEAVRVADPFPYYWDHKGGIPDEIKMPIYSFEAQPNGKEPMYPDAPGVTELGMLRLKTRDLSARARAAAVRKVDRNGEEVWALDFDIRMTLHSASLTFALLVHGKEYTMLNLDFS
ncbi:hypothetical protein LTR96_002795 [Exophiala xenobiotica]|nr:hypothetical protein LTR92_005333 [Exophiala xenobiotica]KAK5273163.1 hypothetical protein LTR96_002795 [Exophiala xenobiotica]KAK5341160.1 hypothetical protein LTR98_001952 [Exophiala xenobiotica]KAK5443712.1 hypothetical protein LTR18_004973 [Exophiala xenobiotica]KAK5558999.1 hypothetical protein LTR46_003188 [Exophiala xenobiotica]